MGDGIAYGNLEFRWKFARFYFIKQNFYLSLNTFLDAGKVVKSIDFDKQKVTSTEVGFNASDYVGDANDALHVSWGAGLRIVMNQNFIIAVDHGRATDKRDGNAGTYIGLNFLF